jgi:methylenetetrahydrofolate--tRNA-(uracil-5-)-methyltransferase
VSGKSGEPEAHVVGGGLAGCEAAWQLARAGIKVRLYEKRKAGQPTAAHRTDMLAELVCSNSFRSDDALSNAVGLLHEEMRVCGSLILREADAHTVPAGGALAVDRDGFSVGIEQAVAGEKLIDVVPLSVDDPASLDGAPVIVASGPLTSDALAASILRLTGKAQLAFFDAIAPIVHRDSVNFKTAWYQSRYDKGEGKDYVNLPMSEKEYNRFVEALVLCDSVEFKEWEKNTPYFDGCLPIEVMAARGRETLRFGPMKPVGLRNPHRQEQPYAVVQLRQDNKLGTLYNMVGFQTKLRYGDQTEVFRTIPGLEKAEFARLGGIHRNTFINSPELLDETLRLKSAPHIRFAGQITGVEGYVESAACGLAAGLFLAAEIRGTPLSAPCARTAIGALLRHITGGAHSESFQPMNVNYGLFEPLDEESACKKTKRAALYERSMRHIAAWRQTAEEALRRSGARQEAAQTARRTKAAKRD